MTSPSPIPEPETWRSRAARAWPLLWVALADAWFRGPFFADRAGPTVLIGLGAAFLGCLLVRARRAPWLGGDRAFRRGVLAMVLLCTLVRLPALLAPGSSISSDSAIAGLVADELRAGQLPAPAYLPGFPEGTLKPHLTALLGRLLPGVGTPLLYALTAHLFHLLWLVSAMWLAWRAGGLSAALAAGAYLSVSSRFLTAFSVNNIGQHHVVNALGALALVLVVASDGLLLPGFVLGLALWQQLLAVYFILVVAIAAAVTPRLRSPGSLAGGLVGLIAGASPMLIWNAAHRFATFDFFRRGAKHPADRLADLPDRIAQTVSVSFPKLFGLVEVPLPHALGVGLALLFPLTVLWVAWSRRDQLRRERGRSPIFLAATLLVVVLCVFTVSKFSHRGVNRPRYLPPLYTSVAVAGGVFWAGIWRRSRTAAVGTAAAVLAVNLSGLVPWLSARADVRARDEDLVSTLNRLGVRTGYAGYWVAPRYTFLSGGRVVLSGELGPDVSWVHPEHAARVRDAGPDAFIVPVGLAPALSTRLDLLGIVYQRTDAGGHAVFHHLSPRPSLDDLAGYDAGRPPPEDPGA